MARPDKGSDVSLLSNDTLSFSNVYVLGDSLVDSGNVLGLLDWYNLDGWLLPEGAPVPEDGYFEGRFTNGYTYADLIANRYVGAPTEAVFPYGYDDVLFGWPVAPFARDPIGNSLNFAYGGAQVFRDGSFLPGIDGQTDALRDAVDGRFGAQDLVIISIGGNDVRELAPASGTVTGRDLAMLDIQRSVAELLSEMSQLASDGLKTIMLTGMPDVGLIPEYDANRDGRLDSGEQFRAELASEYSAYFDFLVRTEVIPQLEALGVTVHYTPLLDITDANGNVIEEGALSLVLPTIAALNGITVEQIEADPLAYADLIYFDPIHPTAQVHALVGSYMHARMEGTEWIEIMPMDESALLRSFTGVIDFAGETDSFGIRLQKGETYTIEVLGMSTLGTDGSLADPWLQLADKSGNAVTQGFTFTSGNDSGLGFDASFTFTANASGRFTITVGAEGSLTGSYVVQIGTAQVSGTLAAGSGPETSLDIASAFELSEPAIAEPVYADHGAKAWGAIDPMDVHIF